jgi:hypothetical protein
MATVATTVTSKWAGHLAGREMRGAYWQHVVLSKVELARNELQKAAPGAWLATAAALLQQAEDAARQPGSAIRVWLSGSPINRAFVSLHAAQVLMAKHATDERVEVQLAWAMSRVRTTMPVTAERRDDLEHRYAEATAPGATDAVTRKRWVLEKALEWSYSTTDAQYARLRSFRNILSGVSIAVLCFAVGLAVMGLIWPETLALCFGSTPMACPTGTVPSPRDALVIEVLGAAGGALAAVLAVSKMHGTSTPYSVPLALAMLKLPFGALSAILGLVLIHGRFIPGLTELDTSGQILAYAIVLGVAQHLITGLVDRRGQELLAGIPGKRSPNNADGTGSLPARPKP